MERKANYLSNSKPWENLTAEERKTVKESWKNKLPEHFDVFCSKGLMYVDDSIYIPGNLYVEGVCFGDGKIYVEGDFSASRHVDLHKLTVEGSVEFSGEFIQCDVLSVAENCIVKADEIIVAEFYIAGSLYVEGKIVEVCWVEARKRLYLKDRKNHKNFIIGT